MKDPRTLGGRNKKTYKDSTFLLSAKCNPQYEGLVVQLLAQAGDYANLKSVKSVIPGVVPVSLREEYAGDCEITIAYSSYRDDKRNNSLQKRLLTFVQRILLLTYQKNFLEQLAHMKLQKKLKTISSEDFQSNPIESSHLFSDIAITLADEFGVPSWLVTNLTAYVATENREYLERLMVSGLSELGYEAYFQCVPYLVTNEDEGQVRINVFSTTTRTDLMYANPLIEKLQSLIPKWGSPRGQSMQFEDILKAKAIAEKSTSHGEEINHSAVADLLWGELPELEDAFGSAEIKRVERVKLFLDFQVKR